MSKPKLWSSHTWPPPREKSERGNSNRDFFTHPVDLDLPENEDAKILLLERVMAGEVVLQDSKDNFSGMWVYEQIVIIDGVRKHVVKI